MTTTGSYAVATILTWIGWASLIRFAYLGLNLLVRQPGLDRNRTGRGLAIAGVLGALLLILGATFPGVPSEARHGWSVPLLWFVMPFSAWAVVVSVCVVLWQCGQAFLGVDSVAQRKVLVSAVVWAAVAGLFFWMFKRDADAKIEILRGGIPLSAGSLAALIVLAFVAMGAMVAAARSASARGFVRGVSTHLALLAGTVVFGIPFAWLVITSFKEDRDLAGSNGIVWVPQVQETVTYRDEKHPLYETNSNGRRVEGQILETRPGGVVILDIYKPMSLRGSTIETVQGSLKEIPKQIPVVSATLDGQKIKGKVIEEMDDGRRRVEVMEPASMAGRQATFEPAQVDEIRHPGLRVQNYSEALDYMPPETNNGLVYLKNTLILVVMTVIGTILSSAIVAYAFSRMRFPGKNLMFTLLLSTMMLPGAVTLLPQFLIFRSLGWIDSLYPLWVPSFFASAFNVFLLRQFFMGIPMELEDAAKIDGCSFLKTFWKVMIPQIAPALAVIAIWTFVAAWNNFMGPLIYVNSPENMPISYALQLYASERTNERGLMMAFATMSIVPVLVLFIFCQKYFIEGVTLTGLGGR